MICFFIRRYNDIDHMVPVIYKLASEGTAVRVLSLEPWLDLAGDYRLRFLREQHNVRVEYVYEAHAPTLAHRTVARLLCAPAIRRGGRRRALELCSRRSRARSLWWFELLIMPMAVIYRSLAAWLYERVWRPWLYTRAWADGLLEEMRPSLLVFDWVPQYKFMIEALLQAARLRGIRCVAIPHGVHVISDELRGDLATRAGHVVQSWPLAVYDAVAVPEHLFRGWLLKAGVAADKVEVLGSPRFCAEWERVHDSITPPSRIPPDLGVGRVKVVYMDKSFRSRMYPEAVIQTLARLDTLDGVTLVIKPETRSNTPSSRRTAAIGLVASTIASLDLIRWADVIIGVQSSILLEVLVQRKILLYPKFFSENVTFFEDYGACWMVNDPEETVAAVTRLRDEPGFRPYPAENAERLLIDVVYRGIRDRDVLGDYRDFLLRHAGLAEAPTSAVSSA